MLAEGATLRAASSSFNSACHTPRRGQRFRKQGSTRMLPFVPSVTLLDNLHEEHAKDEHQHSKSCQQSITLLWLLVLVVLLCVGSCCLHIPHEVLRAPRCHHLRADVRQLIAKLPEACIQLPSEMSRSHLEASRAPCSSQRASVRSRLTILGRRPLIFLSMHATLFAR